MDTRKIVVPPIDRRMDSNRLFLNAILFQNAQAERREKTGRRRRLTPREHTASYIQFLAQTEKSIQKKHGTHPFLFGSVLCSLSPSYRRIFEMAARLKIPVRPILKTRFQLLETFDPFGGVGHFPAIGSQVDWYSTRAMDPLYAKDILDVMAFNLGAHHDLLHVVLSILIPPPSDLKQRRDYFLFVESFTFIQEFYISRELGAHWSNVFSKFNSTYRSYRHDRVRAPDDKTLFLGMLMTHFASLRYWTRAQMRRRLPRFAPFIAEENMGFQDVFSDRVTNAWFDAYQTRAYPAALRRRPLNGLRRLNLESFRLEDLLKDEAACDRIWEFAQQVLR